MKCQALQRRLITTTEACVEKDAQIQEQEKIYVELKAILARQPGPEAALHISALQVLRPCSQKPKVQDLRGSGFHPASSGLPALTSTILE